MREEPHEGIIPHSSSSSHSTGSNPKQPAGDTEASLTVHLPVMMQATVTGQRTVCNDLILNLPGSLNPNQPCTPKTCERSAQAVLAVSRTAAELLPSSNLRGLLLRASGFAQRTRPESRTTTWTNIVLTLLSRVSPTRVALVSVVLSLFRI